MADQWLPVPKYEELYEVSNLGRVRSLPRSPKNGKRGFPGTLLKLKRVGNGYYGVNLWKENKQKTVAVHVLVAESFIGIRPTGLHIRHLDGNKKNNQLINLTYGTRSENALDSVMHGTHFQSSKTKCPKDHEYTQENTLRWANGGRRCAVCEKEREATRHEKD